MKDNINNKFSTAVINELTELKESRDIKKLWADSSWHPYTDMDYYFNIIINEEGFIRPYIVVKYLDNKPVSIIIAQIKNVNVNLSIGYKNVLTSKANCLNILYGGVLGDKIDTNIEDLFQTIKYSVKQSEFDFIHFDHPNIGTDVYKIAKRVFRTKLQNPFKVVQPHWLLNLPSGYEEYLDSKSKRVKKNAKYYTNKVNKKLGDAIEVKCYRGIPDLDILVKHTSEVSQKTYQHNFKSSMSDNLATRTKMKFAIENSWLRSYVIYINSLPVAFWNGFMYKGTFFTGATGYLPEYHADRLGTYILLRMIKDMIETENIKKIDFGFGDADYKRIYGNEELTQANIFVFASSLKGFKLFGMSTVTSFISFLSTKVLKKLKVLNWVKKKWRKKLRN